jgi:hypothetical protein
MYLPLVDPQTIPASWRCTPLHATTAYEVTIYRGFSRCAQERMRNRMVVRPEEDMGGGIFSRRLDAAHDAIFNRVGRTPTLSGLDAGGVVAVHLRRDAWNLLVRHNGISERTYPGFAHCLNSTEIRVNSSEAGELINNGRMSLLPPDQQYDFR